MARILGGGMFGEMRGKLGSMVFARNRGGAYSRSYAKPVDPMTVAQLAARNNFGTASSNYHSLPAGTKSLWQNFANSVFNPKTGTMGVPSGFNAFVSLLNAVSNTDPFVSTVSIDSTPAPATFEPFTFDGTPPEFALEANIRTSASGAIPYNFGSVTNFGINYNVDDAEIEIDFELIPTGLIGPGGTITIFRDFNANKFGFSVFMSNPVDQPGMFVQNPYLIKLGDVEIPTLTTGVTPSTSIKIINAITKTMSNYSAWPANDQWVLLTIFAKSETGMLLRIGSEMQQL